MKIGKGKIRKTWWEGREAEEQRKVRKEEGRKGFRAPHLADNEGGEVRWGEERVAGEGKGKEEGEGWAREGKG